MYLGAIAVVILPAFPTTWTAMVFRELTPRIWIVGGSDDVAPVVHGLADEKVPFIVRVGEPLQDV